MAKIKEIFTSIQGEGPFVGYKQLFVRFCGCNLNCLYCDTDFGYSGAKEYTAKQIISICNQNQDCHSVSLTGGEPLLNKNFIKELYKEGIKLPLYLETNGTMHDELSEVIDCIDFISADIKLPSATGLNGMWANHDRFFSIAQKKLLFAKVVFDKNITDEEILKTANLCSKYDVELVLQPMMIKNTISVNSEFIEKTLDKFLKLHKKTRLIPQVHKFLNVI